MATQVHLGARVRDNLATLSRTQNAFDQANSRVASGLKVTSAIDDPVKFFKSQALSDRASVFSEKKDGIQQGMDALKTTINGLSAVTKMAKSIRGQLMAMKSADSSEVFEAYKKSISEMIKDISNMAKDTKYEGSSYLSDTLHKMKVPFSDREKDELEIKGINLTTNGDTGKLLHSGATVDASVKYDPTSGLQNSSKLDISIKNMEKHIKTLQAKSSTFGGQLTLLKVRSEFTQNYVKNLEVGSDDLVLADTKLEGSRVSALKTSQGLSLNALSVAAKQDGNILQLVRG